ncbi:MAG: type II secretion system F family protein, partial [Solirubrobacteraceae bacterium]
TGANPGRAVATALAQLRAAHVALGAVVVISDGVGVAAPRTSPPRALTADAAGTHTPVVTLGLEDLHATSASLTALARSVPGQFALVPPAQLPALIGAVAQSLERDYLVSYRSHARRGDPVEVSVTVAGLRGSMSSAYLAPGHAPSDPARTPLKPIPGFSPSAPRHAHAPTSPASASTHASATTPAPVADPIPATVPASSGSSRVQAAIIAGVCGLLIALGVALALYRPRRRSARSRIGTFTPAASPELIDPLGAPAAKHHGALGHLSRSSWWPPFVEAVEISRSSRSPTKLVRLAAALGVFVGVMLALVSGVPELGLLPALAWPFVLRSLVMRAATKQRTKFADGLPNYLQDLASSIRVGRSFIGALAAVAESADEPTKSEFERAATNEALGRPVEECLEAVSRRMQSTEMDQVALIAGLNRKSGANIAESLDRVAEGARERADMKREMRALTAQAKMSSSVLTGLPGLLLIGLSVISPLYAHPLFHTTLGLVALGVGAMMVFAGWKVMKKITNVEAV